MNPITQTIKEREEVFEKRIAFSEDSVYSQNFKKAIQSHISQSHIALLESVVGMVEKKLNMCEFCHRPVDEDCQHYAEFYNSAIKDILTELQEALKELKDEK